MTLTILEGADCTGKSTLAGRVVDELRRCYPGERVTYLHADVPTVHPLDAYVAPLLDYRPGAGRHVVCDRWHVGESVYPAVLDRPTHLTPSVRWYVEAFLRSRGAVLIYCAASYDYLRDCGVARGDDGAELARIARTQDAFQAAIATSSLPRSVEDVTDDGMHDEFDYRATVLRTVAFSTYQASRAEALNPFTTYVGPPRPRLLLVGDRRGTSSHDLAEFGDWPAFVPRLSTSGDYLLSTFTSAELRVPTHGLTADEVGLVNANDVDDVRDCWEALGRPEVVGLGVNARRELRRVNVPHRSAVHPQYQRRFLYHDRVDYLDQLLGRVEAQVTT